MSKAPPKKHDAVDLLDADHIAVKKLFTTFRKLCDSHASGEEKREVADKICQELTVHAQIEEEIFYPQVRAAINDDALLDEAEVEHGTAKDLIAQISGMDPEDDLYDARVTVLGEYIDHHVKEEREEMFVKARKSRLDLVALADELSQRKMELMDEFKTAEV
ncbi:hemerythrin domain-containing protein [Polaromonas sp. P5_D5]|jgi:hemerythrin superfamily protein